MPQTAYHLVMPETRLSSVILSSPHSGRDYDAAFLARSVLDRTEIRSSEDAYVDLLIAEGPVLGVPLLAACAPRAYVDLNRSADELDPALIEGVDRNSHNPRVSSGLGVIPRVVSNGKAIYAGKITAAEARTRLMRHWHPWHAALQGLLDDQRRRFGEAILLDFHSMPHEALDCMGCGARRPDVVLGDRFGAAAAPAIVAAVEAAFRRAGLRVVRNTPFAGAYITQNYGRPNRAQHVIQIEIDRALYLDEATVRPGRNFGEFRRLMTAVLDEVIAMGRPDARLLAAE